MLCSFHVERLCVAYSLEVISHHRCSAVSQECSYYNSCNELHPQERPMSRMRCSHPFALLVLSCSQKCMKTTAKNKCKFLHKEFCSSLTAFANYKHALHICASSQFHQPPLPQAWYWRSRSSAPTIPLQAWYG